MSTDLQKYSTENQAEAIADYAARRNFEIVRTYADEGRSGLNIAGRDSLKRLINDVQDGDADYEAILVYDISRWGRFQDADESAYYEFICRQRGIHVHYCAEQFENDGSFQADIIKTVKRMMAGEYSRELSTKVFAGQCRLITLGYRQGGPAGYGLRRRLVNEHDEPKAMLAAGEQKSLQTDRVILVPGPVAEIDTVRRMYQMFVIERRSEREIATLLNKEGLVTDLGRPWNRAVVRQILTNEKYIGHNVYNRVSCKLKKKRVVNTPDMWIRRLGAFEAIVDPGLFEAAQTILAERARRFSDADLLGMLSELLSVRGALSGMIIDEVEAMPSTAAYRNRFGSLLRAYQLIGYAPVRDFRYVETNRQLRLMHPDVLASTIAGIEAIGGHVAVDGTTDLLFVNHEVTIAVVIVRCQTTAAGSLRWRVRLDAGLSGLPGGTWLLASELVLATRDGLRRAWRAAERLLPMREPDLDGRYQLRVELPEMRHASRGRASHSRQHRGNEHGGGVCPYPRPSRIWLFAPSPGFHVAGPERQDLRRGAPGQYTPPSPRFRSSASDQARQDR